MDEGWAFRQDQRLFAANPWTCFAVRQFLKQEELIIVSQSAIADISAISAGSVGDCGLIHGAASMALIGGEAAGL